MGMVNRMAQKRYATFWNCLTVLQIALYDAGALARRVDDDAAVKYLHTATSEEVNRAVNRAHASLDAMSKLAKLFEAELISLDWRE